MRQHHAGGFGARKELLASLTDALEHLVGRCLRWQAEVQAICFTCCKQAMCEHQGRFRLPGTGHVFEDEKLRPRGERDALRCRLERGRMRDRRKQLCKGPGAFAWHRQYPDRIQSRIGRRLYPGPVPLELSILGHRFAVPEPIRVGPDPVRQHRPTGNPPGTEAQPFQQLLTIGLQPRLHGGVRQQQLLHLGHEGCGRFKVDQIEMAFECDIGRYIRRLTMMPRHRINQNRYRCPTGLPEGATHWPQLR